ncbi:MAG: DUF488 family protein [Ktedonobacterales bacterium]|nr:DUF488 family protein [Ktedonobacterales bacterium]
MPTPRHLVTSPCCPRCGAEGYRYLGEGRCCCAACQFNWVGITTTWAERRRRERELTDQDILTAPIGAPVAEGALPILISRYWPRGQRKEAFFAWWRELAPSVSLLKAYRQQALTWEEFVEYYEAALWEQRLRHRYQQRVRDLLQQAPGIVLVCYEKALPAGEDGVRCHRRLAQRWLIGNRVWASADVGG